MEFRFSDMYKCHRYMNRVLPKVIVMPLATDGLFYLNSLNVKIRVKKTNI